MGGGRRHRGGHRATYRPGVHRLVREGPHRTALGHRLAHRLGRAQAEHVVARAADQRAGALGVVGGRRVRQAADHRHGEPRGLALDQVAGGGQLVGRGDDRGGERVAVRVGAAAQVVQHTDARRADRHIGQTRPPGAAEGVGDDDADLDAERVAQALADGARGGVRVLGEQQDRARGRVGGVDAGGGHDQALPVLDDAQGAAPGHHPHGLRVDRGLPVGGLDDPALRLGDDLRGDQEDVAVGEVGCGGRDQLGQVVARADLGQAGEGPDPEGGVSLAHAVRTSSARASASRAIPAAASTSVIISGTARQRMPAASTRSTLAASTVSTSQPSSSPEP